MIPFFVSLSLLSLALIAIILQKTYFTVPLAELRRQAQQKDELAKVLYRAAAYGASLKLLLSGAAMGAVSAGLIILANVVPDILAAGLVAIILAYSFVWIPRGDLSRGGLRLAIWFTPAVVWILSRTFTFLERPTDLIAKRWPAAEHTGLFESKDLRNLLSRQQQQPDSRISDAELRLIDKSLSFSGKKVSDILHPQKEVKAVSSEDPIGPILMDELHDSGANTFPVYKDSSSRDKIVGVLFLKDVVKAKQGGKIADIMSRDVHFIHEEYPLSQMLHAFLRTKNHLFLVVNRFEEYVGIATIEDLINEVVEVASDGSFEQYDDAQAVVKHQAGLAKASKKDEEKATQIEAEALQENVATQDPITVPEPEQ